MARSLGLDSTTHLSSCYGFQNYIAVLPISEKNRGEAPTTWARYVIAHGSFTVFKEYNWASGIESHSGWNATEKACIKKSH